MELQTIRYKLDDITLKRGLAGARTYLSMSQIGECPRVLYDQLVAAQSGKTLRAIGKERLFALDKEIKDGLRSRLREGDLLKSWETVEIWADFGQEDLDERVRGHLDGEFNDGVLLHVKPTRAETLDTIRRNPKFNIPRRHFEQMQMYLRHGAYERVRVIYIAREDGDTWISEIRADKPTQDRLDAKALSVLAAVERGEPAVCICKRCTTEIPKPGRGDWRPVNPTRQPYRSAPSGRGSAESR